MSTPAINHDLVAAALLRFGPGRTVPNPTAPLKKTKLPPKVLKMRKHHRITKFREARKKAGLNTATGKPLVRKKHPELPSRSHPSYMKFYGRKMRAIKAQVKSAKVFEMQP